MPRRDIAADPAAMALVRELAGMGYIDSDVGAAMVLLQEGDNGN